MGNSNQHKLFCIVGESNSGKTSIVNSLSDEGFFKSLGISEVKSCTTRPRRPKEINGKEYIFYSNKQYYQFYKEGKIAEYATYPHADFGAIHYFTLLSNINIKDSNQYKIISPVGLSQLRGQIPDDQLVVIYITASDSTRIKRSLERGDSKEETFRRYNADKEDFKWLMYDYRVDNNDGEFKLTKEKVKQIILKEM